MSTTPEQTAEVAAAAAPYLASWLEHQRRRARVPGVQAAVRVGDRLVLDTALGVADLDHRRAADPEHLFRIASHSKTFTATAVLQLVEAGPAAAGRPAGAWVPALAGAAVAGVTVRELLGHQGGVIRDGRDNDHWQLLRPFPDAAGLLAIAAGGRVLAAQRALQVLQHRLLVARAGRRGGHRHELRRVRAGRGGRPAGADRHRPGVGPGPGRRGTPPGTPACWTATDAADHPARRHPGDGRGHRLLLHRPRPHPLRRGALHRRHHPAQRRQQAADAPAGVRDRGARHDPGTTAWAWTCAPLGGRELIGHSGGYPGHITRTWVDPRRRRWWSAC